MIAKPTNFEIAIPEVREERGDDRPAASLVHRLTLAQCDACPKLSKAVSHSSPEEGAASAPASLALAAEGASIAVNYRRDADAAKETVAAIEAMGGSARAYAAAVEDYEAAAAMVESAVNDFGFVDILVHNAGVASRGRSVADTDVEELERLVRVHALRRASAGAPRVAVDAHASSAATS